MSIYTIQSFSGQTRMSFSPKHGGLAVSLIVIIPSGERELLYFPKDFKLEDYSKICGGWPFIFPICARLSRTEGDGRYLYKGKTYHIPIHGFAHRMPWEVLEHSPHRLVMKLTESALSLAEYPFEFEIVLEYEITENQIHCKQTYTNTGKEPMPYYAGFHPYLSLPFDKDEINLHYHPKRRLQYNENLTDIIGELPTFKTPAPLSLPELNESLVELSENKQVELQFPDHSSINMKVEGIRDPNMFSYIQLYHIPQEPFICIEPWMSHPNAMNTVTGVRWLQPGMNEQAVLSFEFILEA